MERVDVEAVEDRSRAEGGHAVILLRGVQRLPEPLIYRLKPLDAAATRPAAAPWIERDLSPLSAGLTEDGMAMVIGPEIADSPVLLPGVAVEITLPRQGLRGEFLWPAITPLARPKRRNILSRRVGGDPPASQTTAPALSDRQDTGTELEAAPAAEPMPARPGPAALSPVESAPVVPTAEALQPTGSTSAATLVAESHQGEPAPGARVADACLKETIEKALLPAEPETLFAAPAIVPDGRRGVPGDTAATPTNEAPGAAPPGTEPLAGAPRVEPGAPVQAPGPRPAAGTVIDLEPLPPPLPPSQARPVRREPAWLGTSGLRAAAAAAAGVLALQAVTMAALGLRIAPATTSPAIATTVRPVELPAGGVRPSAYDALATGQVSPRGVSAQGLSPPKALERAHQLLYGPSDKRDPVEAVFWLKRYVATTVGAEHSRIVLTQLGSALASQADGKPDFDGARLVWEIAGAFGDPVALCFIAATFERGLGTAADAARAAEWYRRARTAGGSCPIGDDQAAAPGR